MKRIYEVEKEKRGVYAGAIGYLSVTGDLDFAIAIRTMILKIRRLMCRPEQESFMIRLLKMNTKKPSIRQNR